MHHWLTEPDLVEDAFQLHPQIIRTVAVVIVEHHRCGCFSRCWDRVGGASNLAP
jgi:hypothetical protein